jgi:hypothetical protein
MATYYWVGGSGNWDASDTTNWASSSGGAGGAGVPTSADDVVFDANSDAGSPFTVTVTGISGAPAVCNDFDANTGSALDQTMTLSMQTSNAVLDIYGSLTLPSSNFTISGPTSPPRTIRFLATSSGKTVTTNAVSINATVSFNGVGGEWTLGSAFSCVTFDLAAGSLITGNYNLGSTSNFSSSNSNTRALTLGSSTVSVGGGQFNFSNSTNFTLDAGTSTITCSSASTTFSGGGLAFYNVTFSNAANNTTTINGANTFNDLTQTSRNATGRRLVNIADNQTVNGTLTLGAGNTAIRRIIVQSDIIGIQRTITLNGTLATLADVDFRDIATAGTVGTWTGTRLGDCLNNSGITFDAPKTVYRVGTGNWTATQWSLSSGGAVDVNNFPLAQDTMIFDANTTTGTHTIDQAWQLGELDCSAVTSAITIAGGNLIPSFYGNITLNADITLTGTGVWTLAGQGTTQTITSAGVSFTQPISVDSPGGTVLLADNLTTALTATLAQGTLDLSSGNRTLTCDRFVSSNSNTRSIAFGTGQIDVTGNDAVVWSMSFMTNFTYTGTSKINATYSGSTGTRNFLVGNNDGGTEANALNFYITNGSDTFGSNATSVYGTLDLTGFSGTYLVGSRIFYGNLIISSGATVGSSTGAHQFLATSGTQEITTNGQTLDFPITKEGAGTLKLIDDLTMGSTRTFTLTAGTLDLNSKTLSAGAVSTSNSNTRSIDFGVNGVIDCAGNFTATTSTNLSCTGIGTITMSSASAKTFAGGNFQNYPTINQGGAGVLTITGSNKFFNITNTTQPATVTFPANISTKVNNFSLSGTAGNLITIQSSTPGSRFRLVYEDA